jgi:hypothetical protein
LNYTGLLPRAKEFGVQLSKTISVPVASQDGTLKVVVGKQFQKTYPVQMKKDYNKLDNPVWYSLAETHRQFSVDDNDNIKFYHPDYCHQT